MSSVYEAEHALIRRSVAVKVLKSELSVDGAQVQRFFNEARATSAIRHPNIVEVIDVGRLPDGVPYLVMELLEGESLGERLERLGSLDIPLAIDFAHQAASALIAAHALKIVHRDLKPDNLFLVPDQRLADRELVKVLDFGIAKLRGDLAAPPFDTMVGAVLGTPPYMSPEQCRGLPEEIDERTDVYALGIILYEMLCGRPPFVAEGAGELMMMHMTEQPERPTNLRPEIGEVIEQVILRALAKRREDRFASMIEFDFALTEISAALGVIEPYALLRRSTPAAVGGATAGNSGSRIGSTPQSIRAVPTFESDTTLSAAAVGPAGDAERELAVTRALARRGPVDTASGVVALERFDQAASSSGSSAGKSSDVDAELDVEVDLSGEEAAAAKQDSPPVAPSRSRWVPLIVGATAIAAVIGVMLAAASRSPSARETTTAAASSTTEPPASPAEAAPPAPEPTPQLAAASATPHPVEVPPSAATEPAPSGEPRPPPAASTKVVRERDRARAPSAKSETRSPKPEARTPEPSKDAKSRHAEPPRSTALSMSDFESELAQPQAALAPREPAKSGAPAEEPGYLSLDSAPWSDVFLGSDRLGTTPLIHIPLPPGKHMLTLRNPELGVSTTYAVEIQAGKTLSRLVGWERR